VIITETLDLLEWHRVCHHLATFAATKLGVAAARQFKMPDTQSESEKLLTQTKWGQTICSRIIRLSHYSGRDALPTPSD